MPPVQVDVIAPMPKGWGLVQACALVMVRADLDQAPPEHGLDELPPEWQADHRRFSALIFDLVHRYGDHISILVYDQRSLRGW